MKRILKPTKEVWSNVSFHVRDATRQRVSAARKAAEKQSIDFNAMVDAAVNEVFDEIRGHPAKPAHSTMALQRCRMVTKDEQIQELECGQIQHCEFTGRRKPQCKLGGRLTISKAG